MKKLSLLFALLLLCFGVCSTQALAADTPFIIDTWYNNFTWLNPTGLSVGGANDVVFQWDGTLKTAVTCAQTTNAALSSTCPFNLSGPTWTAHDAVIYGPGDYTIYTGCPAGCPNCGTGTPINFTIGSGEIGLHVLLDWNGNVDVDVVNVLKPKSVFIPSAMWLSCGYPNPPYTVWDWMSKDFNEDGINGYPMVDGPSPGFSANFNLREEISAVCGGVECNDHNFCTIDTCDPATGACVHTPKVCNDNNLCTTDTCDPISGCVFTPINGNDNNACTIDSCDPATGIILHTPIVCNDNNVCTTDSCNPATGCVFTPIANCCTSNAQCNDNNVCTTDACVNNVCVHTLINDGYCCPCDPSFGMCDPVRGCPLYIYCPAPCNDNNACTTDTCLSAVGCVHTLISCNDNNACTADSCDTATGCVFTPIVCNDNNACTTDTCDPAIGCVYTPIAGCVPGADVGIYSFTVPTPVKQGKTAAIFIQEKNYGTKTTTGTVTLYKDGVAVMSWTNVVFKAGQIKSQSYDFKTAGYAGRTIMWYAEVIVPNDPNLSNNTSAIKSMVITK